MEEIERSGLLFRDEPGIVRGFKKRWCVQKGGVLFIYKDNTESEVLTTIHGEDITGVQFSQGKRGKQDTNVYFEVATKHGVEVLAAEGEKESSEWIESIRKIMTSTTSTEQNFVKTEEEFVNIECFVQKGIRVTGKIQPHILAEFSAKGGAKKHQDERGWFCEKYISASEVLNVLSCNGWELSSSFASESSFPNDNKMMPCHVFVFKR
jgi:hypothetical protein